MKKLIPALCMLLVAAALMGTSTYAWFTMNEFVTATDMSVTAATPSSLYIGTTIDAQGKLNNKTFEAEAATKTAALLPTSAALPTVGAAIAPTWFKGASDNAGSSGVNSAGYSAIGAAPEGKAYYLMNTFYVMSAEEAFSDLALVGLTVTHTNGAEQELMKALRVMIVASDSNGRSVLGSVAYTTGNEDIKDATAVTGTATTATTEIDFYSFGGTGTADDQVLIETMAADTTYRIDVYVYLDGEDADCTSDNRNELTVTNTEISLTFGAAGTAPAGA